MTQTTTRMAAPYRVAVEQLRDAIDHRASSLSKIHRQVLHDYVNNLTFLLANGMAPTEELTLEQAAKIDARAGAHAFCTECGRFEVIGDACRACGAVLCGDCGIEPATRCDRCAYAHYASAAE